jgi:hypothetical protein
MWIILLMYVLCWFMTWYFKKDIHVIFIMIFLLYEHIEVTNQKTAHMVLSDNKMTFDSIISKKNWSHFLMFSVTCISNQVISIDP